MNSSRRHDAGDPHPLEARLGRVPVAEPPHALRARVLSAVDAALSGPRAPREDGIVQWSLLAVAAAVTLLVMAWGGQRGLALSPAEAAVARPASLADRTTLTQLRLELLGESSL